LCATNSPTVKTDADFAGLKPKYVKTTSGGTRTPTQSVDEFSLESKLCKKLDAMQPVLDHCQNAIQTQNVQLVAQGNEITRLSQSVKDVKNVGLPTVQNNTGISAGLPNPTALNTPEQYSVQARPSPTYTTYNSQKAKSARSGVLFYVWAEWSLRSIPQTV